MGQNARSLDLSCPYTWAKEYWNRQKSRQFKGTTEWMFSKEAFTFIKKQFSQADIDIFDTRASKKINKYISWKPDANPTVTEAFSVTW